MFVGLWVSYLCAVRAFGRYRESFVTYGYGTKLPTHWQDPLNGRYSKTLYKVTLPSTLAAARLYRTHSYSTQDHLHFFCLGRRPGCAGPGPQPNCWRCLNKCSFVLNLQPLKTPGRESGNTGQTHGSIHSPILLGTSRKVTICAEIRKQPQNRTDSCTYARARPRRDTTRRSIQERGSGPRRSPVLGRSTGLSEPWMRRRREEPSDGLAVGVCVCRGWL